MKLMTTVEKDQLIFELPDEQGTIEIWRQASYPATSEGIAIFIMKDHSWLVAPKEQPSSAFERVILLKPNRSIESHYLLESIQEYVEQQQSDKAEKARNIPSNQVATIEGYWHMTREILAMLGYTLPQKAEPQVTKKPAGKARHRWSKEVSQIPFYVEVDGSQATVIWQKRNEMLIKAGAVLSQVAPLNKDGSVGYATRFAEKIREDHQDKLAAFVTTEDIVLKSVNEVGMFLYFGGRNGWLVLLDENGKSINEWTVVE